MGSKSTEMIFPCFNNENKRKIPSSLEALFVVNLSDGHSI